MPRRGRGRPLIQTLTESQRRLLQAIEAHLTRTGTSPTMRELADELGYGVANVFKQIQRLERNGYISRVAGKSRSIKVLRHSSDDEVVGLVAIPLVGTVVAGHPLWSPENVQGELLVEQTVVRTGRHFALRVVGESMRDAGIGPGDLVIVRQQPLADHRDIVVALLNDEATVKRLHSREGEIFLLPENPHFSPIPVGADDDLRIVGKVVAIRRSDSQSASTNSSG